MVITDAIPANLDLFVGDLGGPGPVVFSPLSSGLTYSYGGTADLTDDLSFDDGSGPNYIPTADADGFDPNVTSIVINPKGVFNGKTGIPNPSFNLIFQVRVR